MMIKLLVVVAAFQLAYPAYIREPATCHIPTLDYGWVEADPSIWGNNFVGKFRCDPGFVLTGAETVKCREGVWNISPTEFPVCAAIGTCDASRVPRISKNGVQLKKSFSGVTIYRYRCNKGYTLVGPSSAHCTPGGWSVSQAPVCAKPGCDVTELITSADQSQYIHSRATYGGAMYRFYCSPGTLMEGSSVVFCDGKSWSGTSPQCLAAPHPPSLSVIVNSIHMDTPAVSPGDKVTLACHSLAGNPPPALSFYLNDQQVGEEGRVTASFTFTAGLEHDGVRMSCAASNKMVSTPVFSLYKVLTIKYPPAAVRIEGSDNVKAEEYNHYTCTSAVSDPPADIFVKVTDHNGTELPVVMKKMPAIRARKGFTSRVSFGIEFKKDIQYVTIECKAGNEMGEAMSTYEIKVEDTSSDKKYEKHEEPSQNIRDKTSKGSEGSNAFSLLNEEKIGKDKMSNKETNNDKENTLTSFEENKIDHKNSVSETVDKDKESVLYQQSKAENVQTRKENSYKVRLEPAIIEEKDNINESEKDTEMPIDKKENENYDLNKMDNLDETSITTTARQSDQDTKEDVDVDYSSEKNDEERFDYQPNQYDYEYSPKKNINESEEAVYLYDYDNQEYESVDATAEDKDDATDNNTGYEFRTEVSQESEQDIIEEPTFSQTEFEASHMALKSSKTLDNQAAVSSNIFYTASSGNVLSFSTSSVLLLLLLLSLLSCYYDNLLS